MSSADFYVAPDGNDNWSGMLAEPDQEEGDGPFATLARARDAVRALKAAQPNRDVLVLVREGVYPLRDAVVFDLRDSAGDTTTTYAPYPGEHPVFTAGVPLRDWRRLVEGSSNESSDLPPGVPPASIPHIWVADLPDDIPQRFYTLFDGTQKLTRARSQGFLLLDPSDAGASPSRTSLYFPPGTMKAWPNLEDVEIVVRPCYAWIANILPLASVDEVAGVATTALPATYPLVRPHHFIDTIREACWVENVFEALDGPGQWVLDSAARKLYLWPEDARPGDDICAPCLRELIRVEGEIDAEGDTDTPVQGLVFRGLTFTQGDRDVWTHRDAGLQHDWDMYDKDNALVRLRGAESCRIEACRLTNTGGSGIRLDLHCQDNVVIGNLIEHVGGTGILLCGYGAGTKDVNKRNLICNNHIHHCSEAYYHAPAIFVWQSGDNQVTHNLIHDTGYDAIVLSGLRPNLFLLEWQPGTGASNREPGPMLPGHADANLREAGTIRRQDVGSADEWAERLQRLDLRTAAGFTTYMEWVRPFLHVHDNLVEDNEIHHAITRLGDANAIYLSDVGRDNVIHRNYIHHLVSKGGQSAIRTDALITDTVISDNIMYRCNCGGLNLKYYDNHAENNFIIDIPDIHDVDIEGNSVALSFGYLSVGDVFPREEIPAGSAVRVRHNVVYVTDARRPFYREYRRGDQWVELGVENCDADGNLYYAPEQADGGLAHLTRYRELGLDVHSVVGDPEFIDPEHGDFGFRAGSPALAMGIRPIDTSRIGLVQDFPMYEDDTL